MPSAGALVAPVITSISRDGRSGQKIDTATFIMLDTDSQNCKMYFTTDGTKPNPFQLKLAGREVTFRYSGPFTLKPGKRTLKAIAVSRDGLQESNVVTRTFNVDDVGEPTEADENWLASLDEEDLKRSRKSCPTISTGVPKMTHSSKSKIKEAWGNTTASYISHSNGKHEHAAGLDGPTESHVQVPDNGGFTPTNYSGTQYNFWGVAPAAFPTPGPGNGVSYPYHSQLGSMTQQMLNNLNKSSQQISVEDMRKMLQEESQKALPPPQPEPKIVEVEREPPLKDRSSGSWREQVDHIYAHIIDKCQKNANLRAKFGNSKLGRVTSVEFDGEERGFLLTVAVTRTDKPPPVAKPVKPPSPPKPAPAPVKTKPKPTVTKTKKPIVPPKEMKKEERLKKEDPYFVQEDYEQEGTLKPWPSFNAERDCEILRKAMKGIGTDEKAIIDVMTYRSSVQRQEIYTMFKTMFGKDLKKEFSSELSGNFDKICQALCLGAAEYDASEVHRAIDGLGTDEDALVEILCTRTNQQIELVRQLYKKMYNVEMEKDVIDDTSGHFKRLLVSQIQANRDESTKYDQTAAKADAKALYDAGEGKWGTDESKFNEILCSRSFAHLRAVFNAYREISKKDIEDAIKSEFSGDIMQGLLAVVRCIRDKPAYFAKRLQKAMKGLGTDDDALLRVIITRCECDMVQIKAAFQTNYGGSLAEWVKDDTSGDYMEALLALIGERAAPIPSAEDLAEAEPEPELEEYEEETLPEDPTLLPADPFDPKKDCEVLRKAMKGFGTDEAAIISVMGHRSFKQRENIVKMYKTMFGKDLVKELKSETSGNFAQLLESLCLDAVTFDAKELKKAMKGMGTDENALIEIICTRSTAEMAAIVEKYKELFGKTLEDDIISDTSGHFKRLLVALVQANRPDTGNTIDRAKARKDANDLFKAGEDKWGTDESRFNVILCSRSFGQLRATFEEYQKLTNKTIEKSIESEMSGDLKKGMLTVIACIKNKSEQFAKMLHKSMKGLGTDDDSLIRILVTRCEVDMVQIIEKFQSLYKTSLKDFIKDDTSGDYRKLLLSLIG